MVCAAGEGPPEGRGREGDGALTPSGTDSLTPPEQAAEEGTRAVAILNAGGRLRAASAAFSSTVRTRREELFASPLTAAVRVEDRPALAHAIEAVATGDWPSCAIEVGFLQRGRDPIAVRLELEPEMQRRVRALATNLSAERAAALLLEEEETNLRAMTALSLDIWSLITDAGRVRVLSDSVTVHLGWTPAEVQDRSLLEFVHPEDAARVFASLVALKTDPSQVHHFIARARHKDGGWRTLEATMSGYNPRLLNNSVFIVSAHDITARRHAEATLREVEARYFELISQALTGIILVQEGRVVYANPRFLEITGLTGAVLARHPRVTSLVEKGAIGALRQLRDELASGSRHASRVLLEGRHADGREIVVDVATSVVDFEGKPALLCTVTDMTEARALQTRMAEAEKVESIALLASGVAHDFNNLLMTILSWTDIAVDDVGPQGPAASALKEIRTATDRAAELVHQLLAYGRRQRLELKPVDLGESVVRLKRWMDRVLGPSHRLAIAVPDAPWQVLADRAQLDWVLTSLIMNAKDSMRSGGTIRLTVEHEQLASGRETMSGRVEPGEHVVAVVRDSGPGLDDEARRRIFEPFFTAQPRDQHVGAGIGLAAVFGTVMQSGGKIDVTSAPGAGTEFRCYFPRHVPT